MAAKKLTVDQVIANEMPGFRVAKAAAPNAPAYESDAVTPSLSTMQEKYNMPAGRSPRKKRNSAPASKSQMVVVESAAGPQSSDAPGKQLTVLVKDGKIRARQG